MPCSINRPRPLAVCMGANWYRPCRSRRSTKSTHRLHSTQTPSKTMTLAVMLGQPTFVVHEQTDAGHAGTRVEPITSVNDRFECAAACEQRFRHRNEEESRAL